MKKLHSFVFYALVTPVITLSASSVLAQQPTGQDINREQQATQRQQLNTPERPQSATQSTQGSTQSTQRAGQPGAQTAADARTMRDQTHMENRGYMSVAPANGMHAGNLIGAEVKTIGDENVGPVNDLIIDESGQVVAIVVGVGGFLGMGEKDVAIGWDDVTRSGTPDDQELQVDVTRDALRSAPEFQKRD